MEKLLYDEDHCTCNLEWRCVPHDACFIHDSCFCEGSGSFPPIKPPCPSWSDFSYNWYCELASRLELHPHSLLPHFGSEVVSPPEQAAELLPWYMQWSHDLVDEMHRRHLVQDKARCTDPSPSSYRECSCTSEWQCEPHDACFIHDSCFCPGSGSFPPVKPPHT